MEYRIEVRDKKDNFYKDKNGKKVASFTFSDKEENPTIIELICKEEFRKYNALTGSDNIDIDVISWNSISETYMTMYSFYGAANKFIKL